MSAKVLLCFLFVTATCAHDHGNQTLNHTLTSSSEESSSEGDKLYPDSSAVDWQEDWYDQAQALKREADGIVAGTANMREEAEALSQQAERISWGSRVIAEDREMAKIEAESLLQKAEGMRQKADYERQKADQLYQEADEMLAKVREGGVFSKP